jgi:hypothetical protein
MPAQVGIDDHIGSPISAYHRTLNPAAMAMSIEAKLRDGRGPVSERGSNAVSVLAMRPHGSVVVPAEVVQRLGDGVLDHGRRVLERVVSDLRAHRIRKMLRPLSREG